MRIAIFHNLPSGGAKRAVWNTVKYLRMTGNSVEVFIPSTADETFLPLSKLVNKITVLPVRATPQGLVKSAIKYIPPNSRINVSLADLEDTHKKIADRINKSNCDVVFVEQDRYTISPFILKYISKPHVYYCPQPRRSSNEAILEVLEERINKSMLNKILRRYALFRLGTVDKANASHAGMILTNSYFSKEAILRTYGKNSFVSYLGVDTELFKPLKMDKKPYVISVGAIRPDKGFDFIIRALGLINKSMRPSLVVVGNAVRPQYMNYLFNIAAENEVRLELKTLIDDLELVKLYNGAQLCVYAPYLEPFGLVPLESMACGTPIVAVKEGGVRESVVQDESGLLTERDEQEFADAVSQLLLEKDVYQYMSNRAVEIVQEFWTCQHAVQRLLQHMERAI